MASLLSAGAASLAAAAVGTPPAKEALSGVFGSISLTAWICLLVSAYVVLDGSAEQGAPSVVGWLPGWRFWLTVVRRRADNRRHSSRSSSRTTRPRAQMASRWPFFSCGFLATLPICWVRQWSPTAHAHIRLLLTLPRLLPETGALATGLAPTAVALATYFCFADLVLITQCLYYNALNARRAARNRRRTSEPRAVPEMTDDVAGGADRGDNNNTAVEDDGDAADEEAPLLSPRRNHRRRRSSSMGLPGSHRRNSALRRDVSNLDPLARIITGEDETPDRNPWLHNAVSLLAVYAVGTAGFFISYHMGAWDQPSAPAAPDPSEGGHDAVTTFGLVMGYVSAAFYLCARIPQIWKNYKEKSCEGALFPRTIFLCEKSSLTRLLVTQIYLGLALLFFLLSLTGNFTYGVSLVAYSQDRDYLLKTIPWLLGSLGTIVEDCIIFVQFRLYAAPRQEPETCGSGA